MSQQRRPTKRRALGALVLALALLGAACGDSDETSSGTGPDGSSTDGSSTDGSTLDLDPTAGTPPPTMAPPPVDPECFAGLDAPNEVAIVGEGPTPEADDTSETAPPQTGPDGSVVPAAPEPAIYGAEDADAPAALVNGVEISNASVLADVEPGVVADEAANAGLEGGASAIRGDTNTNYSTDVVSQVVARRIVQEIVIAELDARGLEVSPEICTAVTEGLGPVPEGFDTGFLKRFIASQAANEALSADLLAKRPAPDPEAPAELYCARHILVDEEAEAEAVIERLEAGDDFATVAMEDSTGPSGPEGGELGCPPLTQWDPAFAAGLEALDVGEVSGPVQSQFGFHVIERREPTDEEAAAPPVTTPPPTAQDAFAEWIVAELPNVDVTVDERIGTWDPASQSLIVPATA